MRPGMPGTLRGGSRSPTVSRTLRSARYTGGYVFADSLRVLERGTRNQQLSTRRVKRQFGAHGFLKDPIADIHANFKRPFRTSCLWPGWNQRLIRKPELDLTGHDIHSRKRRNSGRHTDTSQRTRVLYSSPHRACGRLHGPTWSWHVSEPGTSSVLVQPPARYR